MHDYSNVKVFNLSQEISLGFHSFYMSDLFDDENICPDIPPRPIGPSSGKINEEQIYRTSTIDNDRDKIFYLFDWGDGSDSGWLGLYESGEECSTSHVWMENGSYEVKVKAKDVYGEESDWSDPIIITMSKNKLYGYSNPWMLRLIKRFPIMEYFFLENI
jgi:hypothetical protein